MGAGVERRVCNLVKYFDSPRFQLRIALLQYKGELLDNIPISQIDYIKPPTWLMILVYPLRIVKEIYNFVVALYQILALVRNRQPDILVTFTLETTLPVSFFKKYLKRHNIVWLISEDSNTAEATNYHCKNKTLAFIARKFLATAYNKSDYITAVSAPVKVSLNRLYGIANDKINVIHNPIDIVHIKKASTVKLHSKYEYEFILAVGRLVKVKRFDLLIKAFSGVRKNKKLKLLILGEGPERDRLTKIARILGVEDDVVLPGFVANPWAFMKHAKLVILTSKYEGFGNVIVESMAIGCPVISTESGGPQEIITNGKNGILVSDDHQEIKTEILRVLNDRAMRETMTDTALVQAENYIPGRICQQFYSLFDRLLFENQNGLPLTNKCS